MIPYGQQWIDADDIAAVTQVLESSFLTQGPQVPLFEEALSRYVSVKSTILMNSATSALHVACLALGVKKDDRVWTSPMSFVASANCAVYCSAIVDFVDINSNTGNICVESLEAKLKKAKQNNLLPKVLIPVHFAGASCDMRKIASLAKQYEFKIIEDASHALGASYEGAKVGGCQFSDISVFSFHPVKMITTGEGGCVCTNDAELEKKCRLFVSHGITKEYDAMQEESPEPWWYEQQLLGFNYRMTELQAALGLSQLKHLDDWVAQRNSLMNRYKDKTTDLPISWLDIPDDVHCSYHLAVIKVSSNDRRKLFDWLKKNDVGCQIHYIPIYKQPFHFRVENVWPQTELFYGQVISIPLFPKMTTSMQDQVIQILKEYYQ